MAVSPIVGRELLVALRRGSARRERLTAVLMLLAVTVGCSVAWDWWGWDRASVSGAAWFGLAVFGVIVAVLGLLTFTSIQAPIAAERDRQSLDSLLATRLSSAEIVLQTLVTTLLRYTNVLGATLPVVVLMMFLGGIDVGLVMLATAGLLATAFALAALGVAVSIEARTAALARARASALVSAWLVLPFFVIMLKARFWPSGPRWLVTWAVWLLGTSPVGLILNLAGLINPGDVVDATLRMIQWELLGGTALVAWAVWRLRPASRTLHDAESRLAMTRIIRASLRRRPRSPCGDDPVFWNAIHANRPITRAAHLVSRAFTLVCSGALVWVISWFAIPAFQELGQRGYGPAREAFSMPELSPFARVIASKLSPFAVAVAPGQARLEFNLVLRLFSSGFAVFYAFALVAATANSIVAERERATWLGLIATPLSGWEILRAKMMAPIWRGRGMAALCVGLWVVGTLAGAVHPLGLVASIATLVVTAGFSTAVGMAASLRSRERGNESVVALLPLLLLLSGLAVALPGTVGVYVAAGSACSLPVWSLWTYEDVYALVNSRAFPLLGASNGFKAGVDARLLLASWLLGTTAMAGVTAWLLRWMCREFDALVGRPTRPRASAGHDRNESGIEVPTVGACESPAVAGVVA
jgi:hypothetical protein